MARNARLNESVVMWGLTRAAIVDADWAGEDELGGGIVDVEAAVLVTMLQCGRGMQDVGRDCSARVMAAVTCTASEAGMRTG